MLCRMEGWFTRRETEVRVEDTLRDIMVSLRPEWRHRVHADKINWLALQLLINFQQQFITVTPSCLVNLAVYHSAVHTVGIDIAITGYCMLCSSCSLLFLLIHFLFLCLRVSLYDSRAVFIRSIFGFLRTTGWLTYSQKSTPYCSIFPKIDISLTVEIFCSLANALTILQRFFCIIIFLTTIFYISSSSYQTPVPRFTNIPNVSVTFHKGKRPEHGVTHSTVDFRGRVRERVALNAGRRQQRQTHRFSPVFSFHFIPISVISCCYIREHISLAWPRP